MVLLKTGHSIERTVVAYLHCFLIHQVKYLEKKGQYDQVATS